jgi:hypothetical protein
MKIYYGRNRLENWFSELKRPEVFYGTIKATKQATKQRTKTSQNIEQVTVTESVVSFNQSRYNIGTAMVRTGSIVLLVPDPIPVIDEVLAIGLIYAGGYLMVTS